MNDVLYHGLHEAVQDDRSYCDRRMVEICIKSTRTSVLMIVAKLVLAVVAVSSHALHIKTPSFIDHANWMRDLMPVIGNASLFDLSLPGTHDTFTYDLSTTVADDANDIPLNLSYILHDLGNIVDLGSFVRNQSITQGLNITQQLDSGVRFIDFRVTYSRAPGQDAFISEWYCAHFMESNNAALFYAAFVSEWLKAHPSEVLVVWMSKHGDQCNTDYPNANQTVREAFWAQFQQLFDGMLFDTRAGLVNETTLSTLVAKNMRMVVYESPGNFSGGSPYSQDGCTIDNDGDGIQRAGFEQSIDVVQGLFANASARRATDKGNNALYLLQLGGEVSFPEVGQNAIIEYASAILPSLAQAETQACIASMAIPNNTRCPLHLMDASLLTNYYMQQFFELALTPGYDLPGAIYLDGLDVNGTVRTGPQLFGPVYGGMNEASQPGVINGTAKYAYVDTMLLATVRRLCGLTGAPGYGADMLDEHAMAACDQYIGILQAQRALYPLQQWMDPSTGRTMNWPMATK